MAWNENFDDVDLIDMEVEEDYISDTLQDELEYELFEQEKEKAASDDFPETFEEWKILKDQERWDLEIEMNDLELMEDYEE